MFISLDSIDRLTTEELYKLYRKNYSSALYEFFQTSDMVVHFTRAEAMYVWDADGNKYMDFMGGFGALNLGHNPPTIIEAINKNYSKPNLLQQSINIYNGVLSNNISFLTGEKLSVSLFTNCGTETVEEAVKIAYMYKKKGKILYCSGAYHGKTLGSIAALGTKKKKMFPFPKQHFLEIPFGDFKAFEKAVDKYKIAAFLVEPIQGEGGINLPPAGYFEAVRRVCDEKEIVLILDEIQSGLGRCGTMFCYEQLNFLPDILCISKSLSGGVFPIGCIAVKEKLWENTYGKLKNATLPYTTFGGNTLACITAIEALRLIQDLKLPKRAMELGEYALYRLNDLKAKHSLITEVRGIGLFIGIEFGAFKKLHSSMAEELMMAHIISKMLKDYNILCGLSANNPIVLKFEPPLIVTKEEIDYFIDSLDKVLEKERGLVHLAVDTAISAAKELRNYKETVKNE